LDINNLELNNIEVLFPIFSEVIIKYLFDLYRADKSKPKLERNSAFINYV